MKFRKLLPIVLFSTLVLAGCGGGNPEPGPGPTPFPDEHEDSRYVVTLSNYEDLSAKDWAIGQQKQLNISLTKDGVVKDPIAELQEENLELFAEQASFTFQGIYATAGNTAGTFKIALKYYETVKHYQFTLSTQIPEPEVETGKSISQIATAATSTGFTVAYRASGVVGGFGTDGKSREPLASGEMYISDPDVEEDHLYVYAARTLDDNHEFEWDGTKGEYKDDFRKTEENMLTADLTKDIKRGDEIVADVIYSKNYSNYYALIRSITPCDVIPATEVTLNEESATILTGLSVLLKETVAPANCNQRTVWTSNDEAVATVEGGRVVGHSVGVATITATVGTQTATCVVNVQQNEYTVAEMVKGTKASDAVVNEQVAVKVGDSSNGGNMKIVIEGAATEVVFYCAFWKNTAATQSVSVAASNGTVSESSFKPKADAGISNSSPFTLAETDVESFKITLTLSGVTEGTELTLSASKRFVVWNPQYK